MKSRLLEIVACPLCGGELICSARDREDPETGELLDGALQCGGGHSFPVIGGIPRLLPPDLLADSLKRFHPDWFERYRARLGPASERRADLKQKTLRSFSYQWNTFSEMYAHWEENFRSYFEPLLSPGDFRGRLVLDAGCGFGRHAFYAAKYGAEVVAMDLSEAVEAAYGNTRSASRVHVVQGDLYHPPLKAVFDLVYCVGVIQHLPDPERGFERLAGLLSGEGELFVWVYGKRKGIYRSVDLMRKVTTRMPLGLLYRLTWWLNILSYLSFSLPCKIARRLPGARKWAGSLPFTRYADLPLRVGRADWFDRLAVPSTLYFGRDEVEGWYRRAGLEQVRIQSREGIGWRGLGRAAGGKSLVRSGRDPVGEDREKWRE